MKNNVVKRIYSPSKLFVLIVFLFLLLPSLIIYFSKYYENLWVSITFEQYDEAAFLFLLNTLIMFASFFLGLFFFKILLFNSTSIPRNRLFKNVTENYGYRQLELFSKKNNWLTFWLSIVSILFLMIYILDGGLTKLSLLGSGLSEKEFRFAETFADENAGRNNLLQIARRVFLPLIIVVYSISFSYKHRNVGIKVGYYWFLVSLFLISVLITLDRAPLITFLVVFFYLWSLKAVLNFSLFFIKVPIGISLVIFFGGLMSYLQHNIVSFDLFDIVKTGFNFIWHRVWAAPTIVGIELSTSLFPMDSEKLGLQYSRLGVLFGMERVGSQSAASIYVGPVSFIGDIWRNLGFYGIFIVGVALGFLFAFLDRVNSIILLPYAAGLGILTITFSFYLSHGVFFSMGVFFQLFFIIFYAWYCKRYGRI